jgi:hypothetical protein
VSRRVWRSGDRIFKTFDSQLEATAAVDRARALQSAGILTPLASLEEGGRMVSFARVEGQCGSMDASGNAALLAPAAQLHAMTPPDGLPRYDPLIRIRPRLRGAADAEVEGVIAVIMTDIEAAPPGEHTIHGDLHLGQMIVDSQGEVWLLDLDDMAIGHAEADLGNFSAHLATRQRDVEAPPLGAMRLVLKETLKTYRTLRCEGCRSLADAYGRLALIRRALKFRERGDGHLLKKLMDVLAD